MDSMRRWHWLWAAAVTALVLLLGAAGAVIRSARVAARESQSHVQNSETVLFRAARFDAATNTGVESISAAATFADVAVFQDRLYLSDPSGLSVYDRSGSLEKRYLTGRDLPPAPLGRMSATPTKLLIATRGEGLLVFDGSGFEQIRPELPAYRQIHDVLPLSTGRIMLASGHGLLIYDGRAMKRGPGETGSAHITTLAGSEGDLWLGTLADGLYHEHGGQIDQLKDELGDPHVLSISLRNDVTLVGTPAGITEFKGGRKTRSFGDGYFARAVYAGTHGVSAGTQDEGVIGAAAGALPGAVLRILELDGQIFALTEQGLHQRSASGIWNSVIRSATGLLTDQNISALAAGANGKLWVGYFDRGLDLVDSTGSTVRHFEDDTLFCINRIVSDGNRTAVATANGLVMFDANEKPRQVLTRKHGLIADHVTDIIFRGEGFVAATPAGLTFFDAGGPRSLYALHGLVNNHVYALGASGGTVAAGTLGGLSLLEGDTIRASFTTANSRLKHNWITALVRVGPEWFAGTYGAGVQRLDERGEWQTFPDLPGNADLVVNPNAMLVTERHVFAGSLNHGLLVFDRATRRWRSFSRGLASLNVTALASAPGSSAVYLGTTNGVARIEETRFE